MLKYFITDNIIYFNLFQIFLSSWNETLISGLIIEIWLFSN